MPWQSVPRLRHALSSVDRRYIRASAPRYSCLRLASGSVVRSHSLLSTKRNFFFGGSFAWSSDASKRAADGLLGTCEVSFLFMGESCAPAFHACHNSLPFPLSCSSASRSAKASLSPKVAATDRPRITQSASLCSLLTRSRRSSLLVAILRRAFQQSTFSTKHLAPRALHVHVIHPRCPQSLIPPFFRLTNLLCLPALWYSQCRQTFVTSRQQHVSDTLLSGKRAATIASLSPPSSLFSLPLSRSAVGQCLAVMEACRWFGQGRCKRHGVVLPSAKLFLLFL